MDKALHQSDAKQYVDRVMPNASPSAAIGKVVFYIILLFVLTAAIGALKIPAVTAFINQVLAYLPNVIAAIIIFVVAAAVAGAVAGGVAKLMGAVALGSALAFGLGGRQVAADMLSTAYDKGREQKHQVRADMQTGKERAQAQAAAGTRAARPQAQPMGSDGAAGARPATG
jgi:Conserved TM helix